MRLRTTRVRKMGKSVLRGVGYVCAAWLVYGVAETILPLGVRLLRNPQFIVANWEWRLIAVLLAGYAAIGIVLGAVAGLVLSRSKPSRERNQITAGLTIAIACAANLVAMSHRASSEYIALTAAILLSIVFLTALISDGWYDKLAFLADPFSISLLLLGAPWVRREALQPPHSGLVKVGSALLAFVGVLVFARLAYGIRGGRPAHPLRQMAAAILALSVLTIPNSRVPSPPSGHPAQGKPNVVLVTMDTVRADHLPVYGYPRDTAPNLRAFAAEATVYSRAFATSDFTLPTHASIFTGLYPGWFGPIYSPPPGQMPAPLQPGPTTLAEALRANGYWTVESVANHLYLSPGTGLARGFQISEWTRPVSLASRVPGLYLQNRIRGWLGRWFNVARVERPFRSANAIRQRGEGYLKRAADRGSPIFLFLNFMDAHWPYVSDAPFDTRFLGKEQPLMTAYDFSKRVNAGERSLAQEQKLRLISQYDGGIAAEDAALGDLFRSLRRLGLYDNTLIIVTADHGEGFLEQGIMDHAQGLVNQNYVHVPLLIKYPGQHAGTESAALASQVDIMPTILEVAGLPAPAQSQGQSLRGAPRSDSVGIFAEAQAPSRNNPNPALRGTRRALIMGQMKLITWTAGPPELYDLTADPSEQRNLYSAGDPRAAALSKRLADWEAGIPRSRSQLRKLDGSIIERLRSLGYTQ